MPESFAFRIDSRELRKRGHAALPARYPLGIACNAGGVVNISRGSGACMSVNVVSSRLHLVHSVGNVPQRSAALRVPH